MMPEVRCEANRSLKACPIVTTQDIEQFLNPTSNLMEANALASSSLLDHSPSISLPSISYMLSFIVSSHSCHPSSISKDTIAPSQ